MDYLLFLQDIRLALGPGVESAVTHFSDGVLTLCFVLPFLIYWGIDKELGTFSVNCYAAGFYMNGILKVTACVSRPWILDARIQPSDAVRPVLDRGEGPQGPDPADGPRVRHPVPRGETARAGARRPGLRGRDVHSHLCCSTVVHMHRAYDRSQGGIAT